MYKLRNLSPPLFKCFLSVKATVKAVFKIMKYKMNTTYPIEINIDSIPIL